MIPSNLLIPVIVSNLFALVLLLAGWFWPKTARGFFVLIFFCRQHSQYCDSPAESRPVCGRVWRFGFVAGFTETLFMVSLAAIQRRLF